MREIQIIRYDPSLKKEWDAFVDSSKNGTFLFKRGYMDYHSDRFPDHSLIFISDGKIISVLPATYDGKTISSHEGLTYGGLVMARNITAVDVFEIFKSILDYLRDNGFSKFIYKPTPHIYHVIPSEEDVYALFRLGATLTARGLSSTIFQRERIKFRNIRKYGIKKALKNGVIVEQSQDFQSFWNILEANLSLRHGISPVHTLPEILLLVSRFPDEIKLYVAKSGQEMLAGVVVYKTATVAHTQYIAASPQGRELGALDLIFDQLINVVYSDSEFFDFGISTENDGLYLNQSLIYQKEGFGARAICYDRYEFGII